jgi:hypothetical protein
VKYSPAGDHEWTRIYGGAFGGTDYGWGVAVGRDGSVFVTGSTQVGTEERSLLVQRYSPSGVRRWSRRHGLGPGRSASGRSVALGPGGSVLVVGGYGELVLERYSATGARRWSRTYSPGVGSSAAGWGVAVDPIGSVFVTGWTSGDYRTNLLLQKYR